MTKQQGIEYIQTSGLEKAGERLSSLWNQVNFLTRIHYPQRIADGYAGHYVAELVMHEFKETYFPHEKNNAERNPNAETL